MKVTALLLDPQVDEKSLLLAMAEKRLMYVTKKPDADNILKAISDALNGIVYRDDSQVCDCSVVKLYSKNPRVEVSIVDHAY